MRTLERGGRTERRDVSTTCDQLLLLLSLVPSHPTSPARSCAHSLPHRLTTHPFTPHTFPSFSLPLPLLIPNPIQHSKQPLERSCRPRSLLLPPIHPAFLLIPPVGTTRRPPTWRRTGTTGAPAVVRQCPRSPRRRPTPSRRRSRCSHFPWVPRLRRVRSTTGPTTGPTKERSWMPPCTPRRGCVEGHRQPRLRSRTARCPSSGDRRTPRTLATEGRTTSPREGETLGRARPSHPTKLAPTTTRTRTQRTGA